MHACLSILELVHGVTRILSRLQLRLRLLGYRIGMRERCLISRLA